MLPNDGYNYRMTHTNSDKRSAWVPVWTSEEMALIMQRAYTIDTDPTLRVNTGFIRTRALTGEEAGFLSAREDILSGRIYVRDTYAEDGPVCPACEHSIWFVGAVCNMCADFD